MDDQEKRMTQQPTTQPQEQQTQSTQQSMPQRTAEVNIWENGSWHKIGYLYN